ncbi:MAG TPA: hypothetical protein VJA21_23305 [Verrucomicrobiae bacterium]
MLSRFGEADLAQAERLFSDKLVQRANDYGGRPWKDLRGGSPIDERRLAPQ